MNEHKINLRKHINMHLIVILGIVILCTLISLPIYALDKSRILFIGDSITVGLGDNCGLNYRATVGDSPSQCYSKIVGGIYDMPGSSDIDAVVLMIGVNDYSQTSSTQNIIGKLIELYPNKQIYVQGILPTAPITEYTNVDNREVRSYNNTIKQICSNYSNVTFIDTSIGLLNTDGSLKQKYASSDGLHLNSSGYNQLFSNIEASVGGSRVSRTESGNGTTGNEEDIVEKIIKAARSRIGKSSYVWGAGRTSDPNQTEFDCTGFIYWCYQQVEIEIPGDTDSYRSEQYNSNRISQISDAMPGDIIIHWGSSAESSHGLIYLGDGKTIECTSWNNKTESGVRERDDYGGNTIEDVINARGYGSSGEVAIYRFWGNKTYASDKGITLAELGEKMLNAIINFFLAIIDGIQTGITKIMVGGTWTNASVLVSDASKYPYLNFQSLSTEFSDWKQNISASESNEATDNTGDGVVEGTSEKGKTDYYVDATEYRKNYKYPNIKYSVEEILTNKVDILNINFFQEPKSEGLSATIRKLIKYWFRALRYLCLACMLSVLIYIGIKVMLSTSTTKKVDYKNAIVNWAVAMLMMFLLPYIMSFILTMGANLNKLFADELEETSNSVKVYVYDDGSHVGKETYSKFSTNIMGLTRFQAQNTFVTKRIGYCLLYLMLIIITIRFTIMYIKRMIFMAYLTMISPIVILMYPIDKTSSGGAQGFNELIRAYVFNAIIQPVQLLVYFILVGATMDFATSNIIYTIVAMGFISQLENILRMIFGLNPGMGEDDNFANSALGVTSIINTATNVAHMFSNMSSDSKGKGSDKPKLQDTENNNKVDYRRFLNRNNDSSSDGDNKDTQRRNRDSQDDSSRGENPANAEMPDENSQGRNPQNGGHQEEESQEGNPRDGAQRDENTQEESPQERGQQDEESQRENAKLHGNKHVIRKMAKRRADKAAYKVGYRKGMGAKSNAKNIGINIGKRAIKGVKGGLKLGVAGFVGVSAATIQAAASVVDGKYNPLEAVGTIAAAGVGANKLMNKVGKKKDSLKQEFKQTRYGKEEMARRKRVKDFQDNKQIYENYEKEYAGKEKGELHNRLNLGEKLASDGITSSKEQIQVMNYIDSMVDKDYAKKYKDKSQAEKDKEAEKYKSKNKTLKNMSTDDVLKWKMRNTDDSYREKAVMTAKAKKDIPESKINGTDKEWKDYVESMSGKNPALMAGYEQAKRNIRDMNAAQRKKKK